MKYSIIDIETTGGRSRNNKITEIAIINMDDDQVIEEYSSLINPERSIPIQIQYLTGITNEMVQHAPKFYEVAKKIVQMTEDRIFVAHNVHFDYSFIQQEFRELGFTYQRELLCTVRLARKILPGHKSYSLGKICADLGIEIKEQDRHRAMGDAKATVKLFKMIQEKESKSFDDIYKTLNDKINFPPYFNEESYYQLPQTPGVYYLWDKEGRLLYIGKAKDLKKRVRQHFKVTGEKSKEYLFKNNIAEITFKELGNELSALLFEANEIKKKKPIYNTALKKRYYPYFIYPKENSQGHIEFEIKKADEFEEGVVKTGSKRSGKSLIRKIYEKAFGVQVEKGLKTDEKELMLEQKLALFKSTLGVEKYNETLLKYYQSMNFPSDHFKLKLAGRQKNEKCIIHYTKGEKIKIEYLNEIETAEVLKLPVYEDTRQILVQYIQKKELKVLL
jgi:DNA polymerase-3 subunit epsilon